MPTDEEIAFPKGTADEQELFLRWLGFLRGAVIRKVEGLSERDARWTPDGRLISLLGIVNHLTHAEVRWIDGGMLGGIRREEVTKEDDEYAPGPGLTVDAAIDAYRRVPRRPTQRSARCHSPIRAVGGTTSTSAGCSCT